jgi:regulator of sigma E protease
VLDFLPEMLRTPVAFLVVLGVLVFIHELGHYLAARWVGVHVETFSIGFGRAIASWRDRAGTEWKLAWIPLGGYVKLHGQERPEDVGADVIASWIPGRTFHEKTVGARAIVIAAGPIANFLLAAVLFILLNGVEGRPVSVPVVGDVVAESPAALAGLRAGDRIEAIGSQAGGIETITRFEDVQRIVSRSPGKPLELRVLRDGSVVRLTVTPGERETPVGRVGVLGVRGGKPEFQPMSPIAAIPAGITQTWDVTVQTLQGVWGMLSSAKGAEDLGGPLRIAQLSGKVAELGLASLVSFIAVLSVNLALINLFPIPVLDGGHLVFYLFEAIRGRPLPPRAQEYGFRAGIALLLGLFVFATWNDLGHLGLFRWVAGLRG